MKDNNMKTISFKQFLDESDSPLISRFVDLFGLSLVFDDKLESSLSQTQLEQMYDAMNAFIFDGQLKKIPIYVWTFS